MFLGVAAIHLIDLVDRPLDQVGLPNHEPEGARPPRGEPHCPMPVERDLLVVPEHRGEIVRQREPCPVLERVADDAGDLTLKPGFRLDRLQKRLTYHAERTGEKSAQQVRVAARRQADENVEMRQPHRTTGRALGEAERRQRPAFCHAQRPPVRRRTAARNSTRTGTGRAASDAIPRARRPQAGGPGGQGGDEGAPRHPASRQSTPPPSGDPCGRRGRAHHVEPAEVAA